MSVWKRAAKGEFGKGSTSAADGKPTFRAGRLKRDDFKWHHALARAFSDQLDRKMLYVADQFHGFMNRFMVQLKAISIQKTPPRCASSGIPVVARKKPPDRPGPVFNPIFKQTQAKAPSVKLFHPG
jgi:hypothetical protein